MKNIEEVMESFLEDYKENPEGWSFWTEKSENFYNIYLIHDDKGYFVKLDSIYNNNPLGIGTEIDVEKDQLEEKLPDFGFRPFKKSEIESFFNSVSDSKDREKVKKAVEQKMRQKPTLPGGIKENEYVMLGPFNQGKPFQYSLEEQEEVDRKLEKNLKKRFRSKYPMYR